MPRRFVVSGCSGGGKSALIDALAASGFAVVPEPGLRIVRAGGPMPWDDPAGFARAALAMALQDWEQSADLPGPVFFDRGLIDAAAALHQATGSPLSGEVGLGRRYESPVFLTPPWSEIHVTTTERRHGFAAAVAEYDRLAALYPALGYRTVILPRLPLAERLALMLAQIAG
ncbi:MAG: AAA family ATPase [Rhodobacteraceae bacterium]|nr:AAA family ATPase [Paracoccaceae bacterium]